MVNFCETLDDFLVSLPVLDKRLRSPQLDVPVLGTYFHGTPCYACLESCPACSPRLFLASTSLPCPASTSQMPRARRWPTPLQQGWLFRTAPYVQCVLSLQLNLAGRGSSQNEGFHGTMNISTSSLMHAGTDERPFEDS